MTALIADTTWQAARFTPVYATLTCGYQYSRPRAKPLRITVWPIGGRRVSSLDYYAGIRFMPMDS